MKALWAGVAGLALATLSGGAFAQDVGSQQTPPPQAAPVEQQPVGEAAAAASGTPAAVPAGEASVPAPEANTPLVATSQPTATGWEGEVPASYRGTRPPMTENVVEAWFAQPRTLLDDNPRGGRAMAQFARSLVETDNRSVLALVDLVKMPDVRDAQVGAVAEGLAIVMRESQGPAPLYAAYIQWAVAQSGSAELIEAFERASGADEDQTAAIGAGGGRGGSPGSGSLSGGGAPGTSGPVGVGSTVPTTGGLSGSRGGGGSVAFSEGDRLLGGASGGVIVCTSDPSPGGCPAVF